MPVRRRFSPLAIMICLACRENGEAPVAADSRDADGSVIGHRVALTPDGKLEVGPEPQVVGEADEVDAMCSECLEVFPLEQIHVVPHFNESAGRFVSAYRCEQHWEATLTAARASFLQHLRDPARRDSFFALFRSRGITVPTSAVDDVWKAHGLALLDDIERGDLSLSP